jgi:uncharacterized protein
MRLTPGNLIIGLILIIIILDILIRLVRHSYKFPIPAFMVAWIDNPIRRKIQPPHEMPIRLGIQPGMTVLEVGPGNGTYTIGTAHRVGHAGKVIATDIQFKVIQHLKQRTLTEAVTNIEGTIVDVHRLPFKSGVFDAIYMIAVIGEIPQPEQAFHEFYRVLSPEGTLAFSELLPDPDYPLARTLEKWAGQADFRLKEKQGNFFHYSLVFIKGKNQSGS